MKKNVLHLFHFVLVCIVLTACESIEKKHYDRVYPSGPSYKQLDLNWNGGRYNIKDLRNALNSKDFDIARRCYWGDNSYIGSLPDIICYIDNNDSVRVGMSHSPDRNKFLGIFGRRKGSKDGKPILWNKNRVWVLVFSDKDLNFQDNVMKNLDSARLNKVKDSISKLSIKGTLINSWVSMVTPTNSTKPFSLVITYPTKINRDTLTSSQIKDSISKLPLGTIVNIVKEPIFTPTIKILNIPNRIIDTGSFNSIYNSYMGRTELIAAGKLDKKYSIAKRTDKLHDSITLSIYDPARFKLTINYPSSTINDYADSATCVKNQKTIKDSLTKAGKTIPSLLIIHRSTKTYNVTISTPTWIIKRQALAYQPQPGQYSLQGIISLAASIFTGGKASLPTPSTIGNPLNDSACSLKTIKVLYDKNDTNDHIYASMVSFNIASNSEDRIDIIPDQSNKTKINSISYNFGNFETTTLSVGVGVGINYNPFAEKSFLALDRRFGITGRNPRAVDYNNFTKFYVFGQYYVVKPRLPVNPLNFSIVAGTNLSTANPLNDLVVGLRLGYGDFGIAGGINYMISDDQVRRMNLLLGLSYTL